MEIDSSLPFVKDGVSTVTATLLEKGAANITCFRFTGRHFYFRLSVDVGHCWQ